MTYFLGIDVGSSDCKVIIMQEDGTIVSTARQSYPTYHVRLDWVEQQPEDWYQAACTAIRDCLTLASIQPREVGGISVDGPAHNVALLDAHGRVLRAALHWSDMRSVPQTEYLRAFHAERLFELTYTCPNPSWTLSQLLWIKENEADTWRSLHKILVTKDYVRFRLTGTYYTDKYDAIGTQLYDVQQESWSEEICAWIEFNPSWLPSVESATTVAGYLLPEVAQVLGLPAGIPVAVGSGDSVIEAAGIGAIYPGDCVLKLGTSANVNLVTSVALPAQNTITYRHVVAPHWFTIAATNSGASTMRWFRDTFARLEAQQALEQGRSVYDLIDALADGAPPGSEGLLFHPYLKGERSPYWNPHLRADFVGIHAQHRAAHFARSVLEGVAFSIRDCLQEVQALKQPIRRYFLLGGGAKSLLWRQILCDVTGQPLLKPSIEDAAFGAAVLAGIASGFYRDWEAATEVCVKFDTPLEPSAKNHILYSELFAIYQAVARDLAIHCQSLVDLVQRTSSNGVNLS